MSCSGAACKDSLSKSEIKEWTESMERLVSNKEGLARFQIFLRERSFYDDLQTLDFYNKANDIVKRAQAGSSSRHHNLQSSLEELVEVAETVNFYENELTVIYGVLEEPDIDKICDILKRAMGKSLSMLEKRHTDFSNLLIEKYSRSC